ncbi:MAG: vitamin K epoxide reductase family protein [Verrucomicrobiales bacterium]
MTRRPDFPLWRGTAAIVLGVVGCAASVASIYATPVNGVAGLGCGIEALSCDTALTSRFSRIGPVPLGAFGLFYFSFWTLNLRAFLRTGDAIYQRVFSWVTALGAVASLALGGILFLVLHAPCLYCLVSHTANLASVILLWPLFDWKFDFRFRSDHFWHFLSLAAISALAAGLLYQLDVNRTLRAQLETDIQTIW